mgnify:FL=1
MTKDQLHALVTSYDALEESFPHIVIIVSEKEATGDEILPDPSLFWAGGYASAKHLIHDAADKILRRKFSQVSPKGRIKK